GRASQANPRFSVPCIFQTAALASLGRLTEAAASARRLLELEPSFRIGLISSYSSNKERLSTLADALRRAGLPEWVPGTLAAQPGSIQNIPPTYQWPRGVRVLNLRPGSRMGEFLRGDRD